MSRIKVMKNTVGNVIDRGKDLVKGFSGKAVDVFINREISKKYQSDIQFQTGYGSIKNTLKTLESLYLETALDVKEKIVLLEEALRKTTSECVRYRAKFYQALVIYTSAEVDVDEDRYLYAIEGFSQAIGESMDDTKHTIENQRVSAKWSQVLEKLFMSAAKEFSEEIHALTGGVLGSDADDPQKELAKSFKESPASAIGQIDVNEQNCNSFCQYMIAASYERIKQFEDARLWYIRALSSKSPIIRKKAKDGYYRVNPYFLQSFGKKKPDARANIIFFPSLETMSGLYDPYQTIIPFVMDGFPDNLSFSTNRPQAGVLYQIHPCRDCHYVEYEKYDKTIFEEQISDFLRLCQGVGADSIEFEDKERKEIRDDELSRFTTELNIGTEEEKGAVGYKSIDKTSRLSRSTSYSRKTVKLGHLKVFSIPDDLIWAGKEGWTDGNDLIKSFCSGVRLEDFKACFKTSSYQKDHLSSDASLKASYDNIALTASGEINQSEDTTFTQKEAKEWILYVHFAKRGFAGFIARILKLFRKS